jgi:hypothetical protein
VVLYGCETWSLALREEHRLRVTNAFWGIRPRGSSFVEHIASVFRVLGLHICVTVESLLISLLIEGYYVGPKNGVIPQKALVINTAVKTSQKTTFFGPT